MRKQILVALLTVAAPAVASAQRTDADWLSDCRRSGWTHERDGYCEVRVVGFRLGGRTLKVDAGQNGGIAIHAWDRDSVEVHERIQAHGDTREQAAELAKQVRVVVDGASLRTDGPSSDRNSSWGVSFDIWVPRSVNLDLSALNGPIGISGTKGSVEAHTTNGPLTLSDLAGDVHARTSNGPLNVSLEGKRWDGEGLDAQTTNGPVTLDIPEGYAARLVTGTTNGPMRSDFPITLQGHISTRRIDTEINGGGPTVRAVTTNGPLVLRRM